MAITKDNEPNNQGQMGEAFARAGIAGNAGEPPAAQAQVQNHEPRPRRTGNSNLTAAGINTFFRRSMSLAPTSQAVVEFQKAFQKSMEENLRTDAGNSTEFIIDSIDSADSQDVAIASILVLAAFQANSKKYMAVFTMLVAGSVGQMPTSEVPVAGGGKPVELQMTAGDYAVDSLWNAICAKLSSTYGSDYEFLSAGNFTLPSTIDPAKDETIIRTSLVCATGALDTYIERNFDPDAQPLTIEIVTNQANTSILMDLNDAPLMDATGLPVRSDITMTLRSTVRSSQQGVPDKVVDIVRLQGFMNLVYTLPPPPTTSNQRADTRRFTPEMILTGLTSKQNLITPETQLLALAMAPLLDKDDQYLAAFMPSATSRNPMRDFGAVGVEVNLSGDENGHALGPEDLTKLSTAEIFQVARMSLFDDLHVSLLVNESGPLTWMNSIFLDAALANGQAAYDAIVTAADNLTGGIFSKVFDGGPITRLSNTRLHMGYYYDDKDTIRDLLDLDYLWFLNKAGKKNFDLVTEFGDTLLGNDDPNKQLADRWAIITRLVPSATLVSYGQVVEILPNFLTALMAAVKQADLPLRMQNSMVDFNNARGRSSFQGGTGLNSQSISNILNQGALTERRGGITAGLGLNSWRHQR